MPFWTSEQLLEYELRNKQRCSRKVPVGTGSGSEKESDLHEQIFSECRRRGWIALHGSMSERTHRTVGEADFCCLLPGGRVLFVECKSKTGKLSQPQLAMKAWMEKLGHTLHVVRSLKEFLEIL